MAERIQHPDERPSAHPQLTKSYAIDQITDLEQLRRVAHHMWEAFHAAHSQANHSLAVALGDTECRECSSAMRGESDAGCAKYVAWQRLINNGYGSV